MNKLIVFVVVLLICQVQSFQHFKPLHVAMRKTVKFMNEGDLVPSPTSPFPKSFTIFVGNLPLDVSDDQLKSHVSEKVTNFEACAIAKYKTSGASRGFGYVRFPTKENADVALQALSGLLINGFPVKLSVAQGTHAPIVSERLHSIYLGNVDPAVTEDQILEMCQDFLGPGVAVRARRYTDKFTGMQKSFAHVDFRTPEEAQHAITELNGVSMMGKDLRVNIAQSIASFGSAYAGPRANEYGASKLTSPTSPSMFIGNLDWSVDANLLTDFIEQALGPGLVVRVRLHVDQFTGVSKGFAHVDFKDDAGLREAIEKLNGQELKGRHIRCDYSARQSR